MQTAILLTIEKVSDRKLARLTAKIEELCGVKTDTAGILTGLRHQDYDPEEGGVVIYQP